MESEGRLFGPVFIALIAAAVIIRGFFTMCEAALNAPCGLKSKSSDGDKNGKKSLDWVLARPAGSAAAFLANRTLTAVIIEMAALLCFAEPLSEWLAKWVFVTDCEYALRTLAVFLIITLCAAVFISVFGEEFPKKLFEGSDGGNFAAMCAPAVKFLIVILTPITALPLLLSGGAARKKNGPVTEEEILTLIDEGSDTGVIEPSQTEMIKNIFEFDDLSVSDVMTHRTDIVAVNMTAGVTEAAGASTESGFSRIPVYRDSIDHIEGVICIKDLLRLIGTDAAEEARGFMRETIYFPETLSCKEAFRQLTLNKMKMAVVADEYGGTAGIVTINDLIESIVGDMRDEFDGEKEDDVTKVSEDTYVINGTADPEAVFGGLGLPGPKGREFDTFSGFIVELLGRIPEEDENPEVSYENVCFTVVTTEDKRITKLKAVIKGE